jgi:hypothetical protein
VKWTPRLWDERTPGASGPSVSERTSTRIGTKANGASTDGPFKGPSSYHRLCRWQLIGMDRQVPRAGICWGPSASKYPRLRTSHSVAPDVYVQALPWSGSRTAVPVTTLRKADNSRSLGSDKHWSRGIVPNRPFGA